MTTQRVRTTKRHGAIIVLMVVLLPVTIVLAAFAINLACMELNRTELIVAADAAARAAGRKYTLTRDAVQAKSTGKQFAEFNQVAGNGLTLSDSDFVFGNSARSGTGRYNFVAGAIGSANSIQVQGRRSSSAPDGPIALLMPNILGTNSFETMQSSISTMVDVDVALVLDRSGSMAYAASEAAVYPPNPYSAPLDWEFCDPAPPDSRWRDLVVAVQLFLNEVASSPTSERVAISTYSDSAVTDHDLTEDYASLLACLQPYTDGFCAGGTNIGGGIIEGAAALSFGTGARSGAVKVIIVMTDGIHNIGTSPTSAANSVADDGAMIFTITFANEADQSRMERVAEIGGGKHFHAVTAADLNAAFLEIAKTLPTLLTK
ncbi:MAG: VWA domain-containing protein [Planctomycetales bacterium]|nr:VWA domain-containing protein [Planctomycetales bacterium]